MIYQIKDWRTHFENNKSREREKCSFCCIPNKQDGLGYGMLMRVMDESERTIGEALYGAFVAVVLVASKQKCGRRIDGHGEKPKWESLRDGWLTEDGLPDSCPLTARQLSVKCQFSAKTIQKMLDEVSSNEIGWITAHARRVPAECPPSAHERTETKERKERKEEKGIEANNTGAREPLPLTRSGEQLLNLVSLCKEVLGEDEMKRQHKRWLDRATDAPNKLGRVLAEVRVMMLENKIKTTSARAAEDLWKRFK